MNADDRLAQLEADALEIAAIVLELANALMGCMTVIDRMAPVTTLPVEHPARQAYEEGLKALVTAGLELKR